MSIEAWWSQLRPETQQWLISHNGDAVLRSVMDEIAAVGGPPASDGWWEELEGDTGLCMPDSAVDWIEEIANEEVVGP